VAYQLGIRKRSLSQLCVIWQAKLRAIPGAWPMSDSWGPSEADLREAMVYQVIGSGAWNDEVRGEVIEDHETGTVILTSEDEEVEDMASNADDGDLLEAVEAAAFADAHRLVDNTSIWEHLTVEMDDDDDVLLEAEFPQKRSRVFKY
jgi:hypothetical protein